MRGVAEGEIELGDVVAEELHLCLGCRACETACPSGVEYGAMLERGRAAVAEAGLRRGLSPRIERLALRHVVPHSRRLHWLVSALRMAQRLGLDRALEPMLPPSIRGARSLLPKIPAASKRVRLPAHTPARGKRRGRALLLEGCIMPELFGDVNRATAGVLAENGFDVVVPQSQGCCGALQAHAGDLELARTLARANVRAFSDGRPRADTETPAPEPTEDPTEEPLDALVVNSAGCGAALRDSTHWIGESGARMAGQVRDICELLDEAGLRPPTRRVRARVCYDDPCHLVHGQGVSDAPRRVLAAIPGVELVPHANASACCGAAGTYNLTQPEMSREVLAAKLDALEDASPDIVASGNPGCIMQLRAGLSERALAIRVAHPVELLAESYGLT
jgi:glycolate oxidase iron-sulfur subunit